MAEQTKDQTQYRKAREEFDGLAIEEKAIFLVESAFSMLARGIEAIGDVFSEQVNKVYEAEEKEEAPEKPAPRKTQARKKTTKTPRKRASSTKSTPKTKTDATD